MTSIDWVKLTDWIAQGIIGVIFGAISMYIAHTVNKKWEQKKELKKRELEAKRKWLMPNGLPPANIAEAIKRAEREGFTSPAWQKTIANIMLFLLIGSGAVAAINSWTNINNDHNTNVNVIVTWINGEVIINQNSVSPTPGISEDLEVNDLVTTNICVQNGDTISVSANGGITVDPNVGSVSPEGTDEGILGFPLDQYDIFPEFSHGALLCKLDTEERWMECGRDMGFQAQLDGCLQFDVNDNEKENNSGSFSVEVIVFSKDK